MRANEMQLFEHQAKVIIRLLNQSWNDGFLNNEERALLQDILAQFPHLQDEFTELMLRVRTNT